MECKMRTIDTATKKDTTRGSQGKTKYYPWEKGKKKIHRGVTKDLQLKRRPGKAWQDQGKGTAQTSQQGQKKLANGFTTRVRINTRGSQSMTVRGVGALPNNKKGQRMGVFFGTSLGNCFVEAKRGKTKMFEKSPKRTPHQGGGGFFWEDVHCLPQGEATEPSKRRREEKKQWGEVCATAWGCPGAQKGAGVRPVAREKKKEKIQGCSKEGQRRKKGKRKTFSRDELVGQRRTFGSRNEHAKVKKKRGKGGWGCWGRTRGQGSKARDAIAFNKRTGTPKGDTGDSKWEIALENRGKGEKQKSRGERKGTKENRTAPLFGEGGNKKGR